MPNQYLLQQCGESSITDICGINDIVETGENANGWYCKFANGLTLIMGVISIAFSASGSMIKDITLPTSAIPLTGTGSIHTQSTPGGAAVSSNFTIRGTYANISLHPIGTWGNYTRDMYYIIMTKWM